MTKVLTRSLWLATGLLAVSAPALASAQDCKTDQDCKAGFTCKTDSYQDCSGNIDPGVGGGYIAGDGGAGSCNTVQYTYCDRATCTQDSDCGGGDMLCYTQNSSICPPCAADSACGDCTSTSVSQCTYRWEIPCKTADDCGPGFDCVEDSYYECSGGGGAAVDAGVSGGSSSTSTGNQALLALLGKPDLDGGVIAPPGDCQQVKTGTSNCQLKQLPCQTDADCGDGLLCKTQYGGYDCSGSGSSSGPVYAQDAGSATTPSATAGDAGPIPLPIAPPDCQQIQSMVCAPADYDLPQYPIYESGGGVTADGGSYTFEDAGISIVDLPPGCGGDGDTSSDGQSGTNVNVNVNVTVNEGSAPDGTSGSVGTSEEDGTTGAPPSVHVGSGGCSVHSSSSPVRGLGWLFGLALLGLKRRRRQV